MPAKTKLASWRYHLKEFFENLAEIIKAASQSNLGIFALLAIALAVLAYFFFSGTSEKIKTAIFTMLFFGVFAFGVAIFGNNKSPDQDSITIPERHSTSPQAPAAREALPTNGAHAAAPSLPTTGFPSNYGMKVCGCWGANPAPTEIEPRCASGYVRVNVCPGLCAPGHPPYAYVCS